MMQGKRRCFDETTYLFAVLQVVAQRVPGDAICLLVPGL